MSANSSPPQPETVLLACSKCGAPLPDEAQFCLKCGKAVSSPAKNATVVEVLPPASPRAPRPKRRVLLWLILALLIAAGLWVAASDNPAAQSVQELVGFKHDQTILDTPFTVGAHTFRYYKFSLPEGSVNVEIAGEFSSTSDTPPAPARKDNDKKSKDQTPEPDNDIQVFVLSEPAFTIWQNGYATASLYDSGKVSHGSVHGEVPAGAGIYYLVFNNKFSPKTAKSIHSTVLLRYKSWLPDWFRRVKERFSNWVES
jgi:hypothetical protein